jgi:hypothetical protein
MCPIDLPPEEMMVWPEYGTLENYRIHGWNYLDIHTGNDNIIILVV